MLLRHTLHTDDVWHKRYLALGMRAAISDYFIPLTKVACCSCELGKGRKISADSCNRALGTQLAQRSLPPGPTALAPAAAISSIAATR
jgi:hypothetical protein